MKYRCYLDSVLVNDEPIGLKDLEITVERDSDIRGLLVKFSSSLQFVGDGFQILTAKRDAGIGTITECLIQYDNGLGWLDLFEGIIFTSDISFDIIKNIATATVEDNSFTARINNNKNIQANFDIGLSKNAVTITPAATVDIDFFDPSDTLGTYFWTDKKCYSVDECFRFIIDFMTDGNVDYESTYFGSGDGRAFYITVGSVLSGNNLDGFLNTSFFDLFTEIDKRFNISFRIDNTGTKPKVVIEPLNDFFVESDAFEVEYPDSVIQDFDRARLYSVIKFGNITYTNYNPSVNALFPTISFYSHRNEEFHVLGESNIDNTLDLVGDWTVDSNSITVPLVGLRGTTTGTTGFKLVDGSADFLSQGLSIGMNVFNLTDGTSTTIDDIDSDTQLTLAADIFTSGEDYKIATVSEFDEDIFIIQTDQPTTAQATQCNDFEPALGAYVYNVLLNNYNISVRYFGGIHDSIASFLGDDTENMRAAITSSSGLTYSATSTILWTDIVTNGYDTGGNYTLANGRYTVAAGQSGGYTVGCIFDYDVLAGAPLTTVAEVYIRQYDSGGTLLREEKIETIVSGIPPILWGGGVVTLYANDGDYFRSEIDFLAAGSVNIKQLSEAAFSPYSSFSVAQISRGTDVAQVYNPADFRGFLYKFTYPISNANWNTLISDLSKQVSIKLLIETKKGWVEKAIFNHRKGVVEFILTNTK